MFPDLAAPLTDMIERIVDLLPLTRNSYYHPAMKGSWSIKNVLPTIDPELDYSLLDEVQHGSGAQAAYLECIQTSTTAERRNKLQRNLLDYCKLDTLAMVRLARFLERQEQNSTNQMSAPNVCRSALQALTEFQSSQTEISHQCRIHDDHRRQVSCLAPDFAHHLLGF